jgi:hypothetical protein
MAPLFALALIAVLIVKCLSDYGKKRNAVNAMETAYKMRIRSGRNYSKQLIYSCEQYRRYRNRFIGIYQKLFDEYCDALIAERGTAAGDVTAAEIKTMLINGPMLQRNMNNMLYEVTKVLPEERCHSFVSAINYFRRNAVYRGDELLLRIRNYDPEARNRPGFESSYKKTLMSHYYAYKWELDMLVKADSEFGVQISSELMQNEALINALAAGGLHLKNGVTMIMPSTQNVGFEYLMNTANRRPEAPASQRPIDIRTICVILADQHFPHLAPAKTWGGVVGSSVQTNTWIEPNPSHIRALDITDIKNNLFGNIYEEDVRYDAHIPENVKVGKDIETLF